MTTIFSDMTDKVRFRYMDMRKTKNRIISIMKIIRFAMIIQLHQNPNLLGNQRLICGK